MSLTSLPSGIGHGPLAGVRIVELAGIGPGPFACMMLTDMGADILRLERPQPAEAPLPTGRWNALNRGRPSVGVDIKHPGGRAVVARLTGCADALVEGFRPGVMERLGLGPDELRTANPALVYARMTGYGQDGPLSTVLDGRGQP